MQQDVIVESLFVSYEIAVQLKSKGFNEPCLIIYRGGSLYSSGSVSMYVDNWKFEDNSIEGTQWVAAPLYQQVVAWLNKIGNERHINVYIRHDGDTAQCEKEILEAIKLI